MKNGSTYFFLILLFWIFTFWIVLNNSQPIEIEENYSFNCERVIYPGGVGDVCVENGAEVMLILEPISDSTYYKYFRPGTDSLHWSEINK